MRKLIIQSGLLLLVMLSVSLHVLAQSGTIADPGPTLKSVLSRRELICGVNQDMFGFGYLDPNTGDINGFDVDFCRAVAAAVLGDPKLVSLPLYSSLEDGEGALLKGQIDLLMHNVTLELKADARGLVFGPANFYNGQTAMVRGDSTFDDWPDLDEGTICVVTGSIAESNVISYMQSRLFNATLLSVATLADGQQALDDGQCDALSADEVQLSILRQRSIEQATYRVWQRGDQLYTNEPFAPVLRSGDDQWETIINWIFYGLIQAEELGITSENIEDKLRQHLKVEGEAELIPETDEAYIARVGPDAARLLDPLLGIGGVLGLEPNFMVAVISGVGNYGEIYNRHLGSAGALPIERGLNSLWKDGGLLYAPDWR